MRLPSWLLLFFVCWFATAACVLASFAISVAYVPSEEDLVIREAILDPVLEETDELGQTIREGLLNPPDFTPSMLIAPMFLFAPILAVVPAFLASVLLPFERILPLSNLAVRYLFFTTVGAIAAFGTPLLIGFVTLQSLPGYWETRQAMWVVPFGILGGLLFSMLHRFRRPPKLDEGLQ